MNETIINFTNLVQDWQGCTGETTQTVTHNLRLWCSNACNFELNPFNMFLMTLTLLFIGNIIVQYLPDKWFKKDSLIKPIVYHVTTWAALAMLMVYWGFMAYAILNGII